MGPQVTPEPKRPLRVKMLSASARTVWMSSWLSFKRLPIIRMAGCRKDPRSPRVGKDGWDKGAESFFSPPNKDLIPFPIFSMIPPPCPFCVSPSFFFNSAFSRWSRSSSDSPPKNLRAVCAGRRLFCAGVDFGSKGRWGSDVTSEVRDTDGVPTKLFVRVKGSKETKETIHTNAIVPLKLFKREGLRTMASYGFRSIRVLASEMGTSWWSWWGF